MVGRDVPAQVGAALLIAFVFDSPELVKLRYKITTMSDHDQPVAANLLDRQFEAAPNHRWVGDTTGRSGRSADNWTHRGSNRQTGSTGTGPLHDGDGLHLYCRASPCLDATSVPSPAYCRSL